MLGVTTHGRNVFGDGQHAVVIGSGIAGLTAARVLVEYFPSVTVVERDSPPAMATYRPGVPQSRHVHALFVRGRVLLERLFPGLSEELLIPAPCCRSGRLTSCGTAHTAGAVGFARVS